MDRTFIVARAIASTVRMNAGACCAHLIFSITSTYRELHRNCRVRYENWPSRALTMMFGLDRVYSPLRVIIEERRLLGVGLSTGPAEVRAVCLHIRQCDLGGRRCAAIKPPTALQEGNAPYRRAKSSRLTLARWLAAPPGLSRAPARLPSLAIGVGPFVNRQRSRLWAF
jgi:hypothetical protein